MTGHRWRHESGPDHRMRCRECLTLVRVGPDGELHMRTVNGFEHVYRHCDGSRLDVEYARASRQGHGQETKQ